MHSKWKLPFGLSLLGTMFGVVLALQNDFRGETEAYVKAALFLGVLPGVMGWLANEVIAKKSWATRLAIAPTALTFLFVYLNANTASKYFTMKELINPMIPWALFWAFVWVIKGFQKDGATASESTVNDSSSKKLKSKNALDDLIYTMYGNPPPPKTAQLPKAVSIAKEILLQNEVSESEIWAIGIDLNDSPIPYTTHELAFSIAMNFFKKPELRDQFILTHLGAVLKLAEWVEDNSFNRNLASSYQQALYRTFKKT